MSVKSIYPFVCEAQGPLVADIEVELPADYLAASTKYRYVSVVGDIFLSHRVNGSNIYKLNKTTKQFDIIGAIASKYIASWVETNDGDVLGYCTDYFIYKYDSNTNSMVKFDLYNEYHYGDGEKTTFSGKLRSGTRSNWQVYIENSFLPEEQEDGIDTFVGSDAYQGHLFLLQRTPTIVLPTTTDFRVFINGEELLNPAQTQFTYILQSGGEHSIYLQVTPQLDDVIEIMYDMVNYTVGTYDITFDFVIQNTVEVIIIYNCTYASNGSLFLAGLDIFRATDSRKSLLRYDYIYKCFEVIEYNRSDCYFEYKTANTNGDVVFYYNYASKISVLIYGRHSIPVESVISQGPYGSVNYSTSSDIWFTPNSSYEQYGLLRYDRTEETFKQYLVGELSSSIWGKFAVDGNSDVYITGGVGVIVHHYATDTIEKVFPTGNTNHTYQYVIYLPLHDRVYVKQYTSGSDVYRLEPDTSWTNLGGGYKTVRLYENDVYLIAQDTVNKALTWFDEATSTWTPIINVYAAGVTADRFNNLYINNGGIGGTQSSYIKHDDNISIQFSYGMGEDSFAYEDNDYTVWFTSSDVVIYSNFIDSFDTFPIADLGSVIIKRDGNYFYICSRSIKNLVRYNLLTKEIEVLFEGMFGGATYITDTVRYFYASSGGSTIKMLTNTRGQFRIITLFEPWTTNIVLIENSLLLIFYKE